MPAAAIDIEGLSKRFRVGGTRPLTATIGDALASLARRARGADETARERAFWALRDITLSVPQGQVLGLIGRNGAGKSTLLKILSRVTTPTSGRAVVRGRLGSLLEVGTGFHPELTGRENIYLNGAILGMSKGDIRSRFDEIVAFSGVERFLDTPVKRYSSGMRVRLAFAVAAHVDPEVLIVDEVLAVGDAAFERKCIGKMRELATGGGRTVLFVSHNMDAILSLCDRVAILEAGRASESLEPHEAVRRYLSRYEEEATLPLADRTREQDQKRPPIFRDLQMHVDGRPTPVIPVGAAVEFRIGMSQFGDLHQPECGIVITNERRQRIVVFHNIYHSQLTLTGADSMTLTCTVPSLPLIPGRYFVDLVCAADRRIIEKVEQAASFEVVFADILGTGKLPNATQGVVVMPGQWRIAC